MENHQNKPALILYKIPFADKSNFLDFQNKFQTAATLCIERLGLNYIYLENPNAVNLKAFANIRSKDFHHFRDILPKNSILMELEYSDYGEKQCELANFYD